MIVISLREVEFKINFTGNARPLIEANRRTDRLTQSMRRTGLNVDRMGNSFNRLGANARNASREGENGMRRLGAENDRANQRTNILSRTIENLRRRFQSLGRLRIDTTALDTMSSKLDNISNKASGLGNKLSLAMTAPILLIGKKIVNTGAEFESKMSEVGAISNASEEDMVLLTKKAREMGMTTVFSASESADALKYMAMAGWKTNQMMDALPGIMNLASASGEDLGLVSDIVTDSLTAFKLQAKDSAHFADVLAKASSSSNTNVALMGETFKYVAPVAGALGYSAEDVAIGIGLMANSGIKGSDAGTALRATFSRLTDTTNKEVVGALNELGISMTDAQGQIKPFKNLMDEIRVKFSTLTTAQQASYATNIFGRQAMTGMLTIINTAQSDYDSLTNSIYNANGAAELMSKKKLDNFAGQMKLLTSALQELGLQFFEVMLPYLKTGVEWLQKKVEWFSNLEEGTKKTIVKTAMFLAILGPALKLFSLFTGGLSMMFKGTSLLAKGFIKLKALGIAGTFAKIKIALATMGASILPVIAIVGALILAGVALYKNWDLVKEKGINFISSLKQQFQTFVPTVKSLWNNLKQIFIAILPVFTGVVGGILGALGNCVKTITSLIGNILKIFKGLTDFIIGVFTLDWERAWTGIKDIFVGIVDGIRNIFTGLIDSLTSTINGFMSGIEVGLNVNHKVGASTITQSHSLRYGRSIPAFAKGVTNFGGGVALVGEQGPELVNLPKGSDVITNRNTDGLFKDVLSNRAELSKSYYSNSSTKNKENKTIIFSPNITINSTESEDSISKFKIVVRELFEEFIDEESYAL